MNQWRWTDEHSNGSAAGLATRDALADQQERDDVQQWLHQRLIRQLDPAVAREADGRLSRRSVETAARALLDLEAPQVVGEAKEELIATVTDEIVGYGPIDPLVRDPDVSEIMVNAPNRIYYEREGRLYESPLHFRDNAHIMRVVDRVIAPLGRRVDEASPMVDARLPDGSRVNVIIPPLAPESPTLSIRKFRSDRYDIDHLVRIGTLAGEMAEFLRACVIAKTNIVVAGGTGSGKTTLLNALSAYIPPGERIITIEDPLELRLQQRHVVRLEARPASIEGRGEVTQRDLFRNALRMRPDRILVGEVRGVEAFDMLQAMNTGHEGSLTTLHANSPRDTLARIENMVLMAGLDIPISAIREQMGSDLHLIVQIARYPDGSRRLTHITEVAGLEGSTVTTQDVFRFVTTGVPENGQVEGYFESTGVRPRFAEKLAAFGFDLRPATFQHGRRLG